MNGYSFTDRLRFVLQQARDEAARLQHDHVGTEHLLLGVIEEGQGVAAAVLANLHIDLDALRQTVEASVLQGTSGEASGDLPYTARARKVLELAGTEATELNHSYVGTEHLLLGLIREDKGLAAQVLKDAGASLVQARAETVRLLGDGNLRQSLAVPEGPRDPGWLRESARASVRAATRQQATMLRAGMLVLVAAVGMVAVLALLGALPSRWLVLGVRIGLAVGLLAAIGAAYWLGSGAGKS